MSQTIRKAWRESSSLIILAKNKSKVQPQSTNYDVLVLKRSSGSTFMPSAVVFPGGVMESSDSGRNWLDLYAKLGINPSRIDALSGLSQKNTIGLIHKRQSADEHLERTISLRIAAIRETFEEVGILLAKSKNQFCSTTSTVHSNTVEGFDIGEWQQMVRKDPNKFFDLCSTLEVAPDIFGLHSWSNWLTPTRVGKKRFDTMFYICSLLERPKLVIDPKEVENVSWNTPTALLEAHQTSELWLPPPQQYELQRLHKVPDFDQASKFSRWRCQFGTTLMYPVFFTTKNGMVHVFPGDQLYPKEPNFHTPNDDFEMHATKTTTELQKEAKQLHRTEHFNLNEVEFVSNIPPLNNHICPDSGLMDNLWNKERSKL